jgi:hypothetical protein
VKPRGAAGMEAAGAAPRTCASADTKLVANGSSKPHAKMPTRDDAIMANSIFEVASQILYTIC